MSSSRIDDRENVVQLKPEAKRSADAALARMPAVMHQLREKSRSSLQALLSGLFDQADDALFELADKATNNQEQNLYFDSMRQVRLCRKKTEAEFYEQLDVGFVRLLEPEFATPDTKDKAEADPDNLSLVGNDELEEMVASEAMVNRACEQFAESLQHLALRVDQLVPVKVYLKNNPVGPERICEGFVSAASRIEIDVKARLVLYKLFDRCVMAQLGAMYEQLNQLLIDANILPSVRGASKNVKQPTTRPAPTSQASEKSSVNADAIDDNVLVQLRELLQGQGGGANAGRGGEVVSVSSQDVVALLSLAQQNSAASEQTLQTPADVKALLGNLMARSGGADKAINQVDEDVINLVSMMFEFILEDRNLAAPMKALLARLQIPMIKVAIADKSFFGKGGHPARRLLNEMASAALGWQDPGEEKRVKDALYKNVDNTVSRVLAEYQKDITVFEVLLQDFRAFQEKEKRRAQILEQRTIDAEDGKAKSQRARAEVDSALAEITAGADVPPAAAQLLAAAWSNVLFITCLKEGADSETFEAQLNTARDLVWSTTTAMNAENRQKLLKLVPRLLSRLRKGLEDIAFNPYQMGQMFKALEKLHLDILRGNAQPATEVEGAPASEPAAPATSVSTAPPVAETNTDIEPAEQQTAPEPTLAERASAEAMLEPLANESQTDAIDAQHLALVSNLTQGSWFEIISSGGDKYRCRLAAVIKPTGKYIFVNRTGMKVAEHTREELAYALRDGKMSLLDDGMLFDRALESVIGNLRQARGS
ncbi:DUF1631 domain-containing protein [Gilvimarinus xylanilyticus]|uniref:DUF1631 domain-containing protein n=1 Tax=Gilvimarinus xylanilyticus TaxID=2944139 RepID=A0A9X2KUD7_9GAMM|nr:DUF1631 domain-containing protein [Gilvimarinus xylanilyticus]MCP8900209.1 DUF1631 domain-containing protein [Gilvimarinus xylanilyticus]